jgi:hypothetical protein
LDGQSLAENSTAEPFSGCLHYQTHRTVLYAAYEAKTSILERIHPDILQQMRVH